MNVCFGSPLVQTRHSALVKSFGRRQAYESPRRTNPRATCAVLWGFYDLAGRAAEAIGFEACRRRWGRGAVTRFWVSWSVWSGGRSSGRSG